MEKKPSDTKIIFLGTSSFADVILNSLISAGYGILSVYTKPDKKVGRAQEILKSEVKMTAEKNQLPVFQPIKFDEEVIKNFKNQDPDVAIVVAYGKILPKEILEIPRYKCINIHASLLPDYRGPSPIQNAILEGEKETGVTIMLMDEGIDTGEILAQKRITVDSNETYTELSERLAKLSSELLLETLPLWIGGEIEPQKQDSQKATLCQLIEKNDGRIFWSENASDIYNRWRAFEKWPGIFTFWANEEKNIRIKLSKIDYLKNSPQPPRKIGEVFLNNGKIGVQTGEGVIILEELQIEGKKSVAATNFLSGYPNFVGSFLK